MFDIRNFILLAATVLVIACSPKGADPTQIELSDLLDLWDSSESQGSNTDIIYTRITSGGAIIEYDFDGDEVDAGLSCYQVDTGALSKITGNRFLVTTDMHANKKFEVELEWLDAGNALKVYFFDDNDPKKITKSQIWTRVANESMLDIEPSCRDR